MPLAVTFATLGRAVDAEAIFVELFGDAPCCFWLDSSRAEPGMGRFSYLGDASGPRAEVLTYRVGSGQSIFDLLDERLASRRLVEHELPFDLVGGYVGYFGYELKADCGADAAHRADTPDAAWLFTDRYVVVDHRDGMTYAVAIHEPDEDVSGWLAATIARLDALRPVANTAQDPLDAPDFEPMLDRGRAWYLADIGECRARLVAGDSYEVCLTNTVRLPFAGDDLRLYRRLRRENPAPYSAFLRIGDTAVLSSSPERFLKVDRDRMAESKPIKGTAPRDADPGIDARLAAALRADAKSRAENTMIVDLVRNDLGRVCEVGSVEVEKFLAVESYATVHQLVSTIRGRLADGVSAVVCARACFPPGSMTGAPKLRTMQIIDRLEGRARGVYSGVLGYFGLNGTAELSVVIRAAVRVADELRVGTGGAIVLDSDAEQEYAEILLKAMPLVRAWAAER